MFNRVPLILVLLSCLTAVHSSCHTCQANRAMCHDERSFSMCPDGIPSSDMFECPSGYVCTEQEEICVQTTAGNSPQPTCYPACGLCKSQGNLFACVDEKTYVYCFGADVPDYEAMDSCPDGYVCNLDSPQVCTRAADSYPSCYSGSSSGPSTMAPNTGSTSSSDSPSSTDGNSPTTVSESSTTSESLTPTQPGASSTSASSEVPVSSPSPTSSPEPSPADPATTSSEPTQSSIASTGAPGSTIQSSTPATSDASPTSPITSSPVPTQSSVSSTTQQPRDATTFCKDQKETGNFRAEGDLSCQVYFYCYPLSGQYMGVKYICPTSKFFDDNTKKCESTKPSNC